MQLKCVPHGKTLCLPDKFTDAHNKFNKNWHQQDIPGKHLKLYSLRYSEKSFGRIPTSSVFFYIIATVIVFFNQFYQGQKLLEFMLWVKDRKILSGRLWMKNKFSCNSKLMYKGGKIGTLKMIIG